MKIESEFGKNKTTVVSALEPGDVFFYPEQKNYWIVGDCLADRDNAVSLSDGCAARFDDDEPVIHLPNAKLVVP